METPLSSNAIERKRIAENLIERGFASIPSTLPALTEGIFKDFERLVGSLDSAAWKINDPEEIYSDRPDLGFFHRTKGEAKYSPRPDEIAANVPTYEKEKWVLHYNERLLAYLIRNKATLEPYKAMLGRLSYMHRALTHVSLLIAEDLDRLLPGYQFTKRLLSEGEHSKSKMFMYPLKDRPKRVRVHRDQSLLTIQVTGTLPGLMLWDEKDTLVPVLETDPESIFIFFGLKMFPLSRGRYKGVAHGVDFTQANASGEMNRFSLIHFIQGELSSEERAWMKENQEQLLDDTLDRL